MGLPEVVSREEWLAARMKLLAAEKEATRERDALNAERRRLPMVAVDTEYLFDGPLGTVSLRGLFGDKSQLIVQHVMFGPDWEAACPGCTAAVDELSPGVLRHLGSRDTAFALVSRAPLAKLTAYSTARGWTVPWYSSYGSEFNYDFQATMDKDRSLFVYNYREDPGIFNEDNTSTEVPGVSCFLRDGDQVFHTYSAFARGVETVGNAYSWLDLTAFGRGEEWEEPKGRATTVHGADPTFTD